MNLVVPDQGSDGGRAGHDLQGQHPSPSDFGYELLTYHRLQNEGYGHPNLLLLIGGKDIDDPVDGLGAGVGVESGEG